VQKPEPVKIEASECKRCCAKTFKGQLECDVCGLMLEGIPKAERTAIAERRKAALHKLGLFYDFKGGYLQTITRNQLETLGLLGDQARGSSSPRPTSSSGQKAVWKERLEWASLRFWTGLQKMPHLRKACWLREINEYDCERYDLFRSAHLPKPDRTKAQVKMGVSEASQVEHNAMRLVYLDLGSRLDLPDRFRYIDQPWL